MTTRTAKIIFWCGSMSSLLIFLILTYDTIGQIKVRSHQENLTEEVVAGKRVFEKYNCNDCHTMLGIGGYYAPDLTRVYGRKGEAYIRALILNPQEVLKDSFRKMPKKYAGGAEVSPGEVEKLIVFFKWVNGINTNNWPPQDHKEKTFGGSKAAAQNSGDSSGVVQRSGCLGCHTIGGVGGSVGPALDDVGSRLDRDGIIGVIRNGRGGMPAQVNLSREDMESLGSVLAGSIRRSR
jgi:nitric oxide reductase subunit C